MSSEYKIFPLSVAVVNQIFNCFFKKSSMICGIDSTGKWLAAKAKTSLVNILTGTVTIYQICSALDRSVYTECSLKTNYLKSN